MSKHVDIVPILQWAMGQAKTERTRSVRKDKEDKPKEVNLLALMEQKRQEYLAIKNFVEEQTKLNKPEDKKPKGWSIDHIAMVLFAMMPINWAVLYLLLK